MKRLLTVKQGPAGIMAQSATDVSSMFSPSKQDRWDAMFPTWAPLDGSDSRLPEYKNLQCLMTEIQLQSILDEKDLEEGGLDLMKTADGREISKFCLEAMTVGEDVTDKIRGLFTAFNQQYVGSDSVFPPSQQAPKEMTAFKDKPYRFQLRDEYTQGAKPRSIPSVRATYYHGKPATRRTA